MLTFISDYYQNYQIITPSDGAHYFFAYYDMRATGENGKHLCHRVKFWDRLPTAEDVCELGYLENGKFCKFAESTAWNFQQGAMLQYHPYLENTVYYNVCENGKFMTVTHNYVTGEKKYADRATACISPDGKWGLGINFGRIYAFRPGYGYAGFADIYADVNAPAEDGVFLVDMETGTSRQICFYDRLYSVAGFDKEDKVLINHITFNTDSDRFVMLVRSFPRDGKGWLTSMVIGDLQGNCHTVLNKTYVSHYYWTSPVDILAHCTVEGEKKSMYSINTDTGAWVEYDMPYFHEPVHNPDIHCNLSPGGNYIIGDGYEIDGNWGNPSYRALMAYSLKTGKSRELLRVKTKTPNGITDIRTDLHARFVWGGKYISFDTTQNDRREIVLIDTNALNF
ncbi:MAG: hypothetical protein IJX80_03120 [Clostridia bacterium]|nr:hypothetical protein [Clostridia bacterium]